MDLVNPEMLLPIIQALKDCEEAGSGDVSESRFEVKLNDVTPGEGSQVKLELLFDGPQLTAERDLAKEILGDKAADKDSIFAFVAIKVKGDAQEAIDAIKGLLEAMVPMDQVEMFADLVWKAHGEYMIIAVSPNQEEIIEQVKPFIVHSKLIEGDGSRDLFASVELNVATCPGDLVSDEESALSHFVKGVKLTTKADMHANSREHLINVLNSQWEMLGPIAEMVPFLTPLLLFKTATGSLEFECDDELKEQVKQFLGENAPPALMAGKDAINMAKAEGAVPMEMVTPILNLVKDHFDGELRVFANAGSAVRFSARVPGIDTLIDVLMEE